MENEHSAGPESFPPVRTRRRVAPATWVLLPLFLLIFAWPFILKTDPDYWWHARTGQLIWESRALPNADPYSFTAQGKPWVMHEWLSEVLFYLIESRVGFWANVALFGLIGASSALLVYRTCRLWGLGELPSALLMVWAYLLMAGSQGVRPQTFTALFVALQGWLYTRYRKGEGRALWALPPLYVLWVNLHGGFIMGLALLGLSVAGNAVDAWRGRASGPLKPLLAVMGISVAATLLNPYGVGALLYPLEYAGTGNASMRFITEWQSPDFHDAGVTSLALALAAVMVLGVVGEPLGLTHGLWVVVTAMMGLVSIRHVQLFGIVGMPLIGARAQALVPGLRRTLTVWKRPGLAATAMWVVLVAVGLVGTQRVLSGELTPQMGQRPVATGYPYGAAEYLLSERPAGNLMNDYDWGGFLIYALYPEVPVFIDGRPDVYGDTLVERSITLKRVQPGWEDLLEEYDIGLVLMRKDSPLIAVLQREQGWTVLYEGEIETLMGRTSELAGR